MKYIAIAVLVLLAACKQNEPEEATDNRKDTLVIQEKETTKEEPKAEKEPEKKEEPVTQPTEKPWKAKMARLHELNCKIHNNGATVSDRVDQGVLLKELEDIKQTLNKDDRFLYNADLVKAQDMATCPK